MPSREGKNSGALDASVAVPLLVTAFDEVRDELVRKRVLGSGASSSREFLYRFITTRALASCMKGGAASGLCQYETIAATWSAQGSGKERIDPAGTFSRWVDALRQTANGDSGYTTSDREGRYEIRVWFFRPGDRGTQTRRGLGAGVNAAILRDGREVEFIANRETVVESDYYRLDVALEEDEERFRTETKRVLTVVEQALRLLPARIVRLLADNPGRLMINDMTAWWQALTKAAAKQAGLTSVVLLALFATYCTLPSRVQERIFLGFAQAVRKARLTVDRPDIYYGPSVIDVQRMEVASFGVVPSGTTAHDPGTDASVTVEQVGDDPRWLRIRVEPSPRFRTNRTKHYVNFGEHPYRGGFDVVVLGPAAVAEHRFPGPGTYGLLVAIAVDYLSEEDRQYVPVELPIDESWGWRQEAMVTAKVVVRR